MNRRNRGMSLFGCWFALAEVRIIVLVALTLIGGLAGVFTHIQYLLPATLGLILATSWYLLFKKTVR